MPDYLPSRKAYDHFFLSHTSFSQLKDAALKGRLHNNPLNSNGVAGRSIAWKVFAQIYLNEPWNCAADHRFHKVILGQTRALAILLIASSFQSSGMAARIKNAIYYLNIGKDENS